MIVFQPLICDAAAFHRWYLLLNKRTFSKLQQLSFVHWMKTMKYQGKYRDNCRSKYQAKHSRDGPVNVLWHTGASWWRSEALPS